ncbi:uncharacterized protein LOC142979055 [Anticarsia gemmatalis]|uniref:uncharacterized protein LOC142979055 n=1 Tax=Anticarsia gemmatalis TaxID=129554 RepID=UPI003F759254
MIPYEMTNHIYFVNSEYESTKQLYLTLKRLLSERLEELSQRSQDYEQGEQLSRSKRQTTQEPPAAATATRVSRGSSSKLDDMLHKQAVNFKAFLRAIENIELESLTDKWEFEDALQILQNRWNAIDSLHWEIVGESEENEAYETHFTKHERTFISMKKSINSKMWATTHHAKSTPKMDIPVFTATALVRVTSADSTQIVLRALIDQGSQISLITERAAQQLGLKREQFSGVVFGIGEKDSDYGTIRGSNTASPLAQQTQLGWILCGGIQTFQCNVIINNLADIQQFWQIEDIQEQKEMSTEDQLSVEYYTSTTKRLESGHYEVRMPMKEGFSSKLGSSKEIAIAQFRNVEKKFSNHQNLAQQYKEFMSEYEHLGHMVQSTSNIITTECFLPHHSVQRADSTTTKLRVVFNASNRTSSGYSLNDLMHKGPNLQKDLQELLLKWRIYRYAYTADIEKMYRQIYVAKEDQKLQQIIWREQSNKPLKSYQLTTVTYGTKSAPFLAMMSLRQLASDEEQRFPQAAKSLREDFYMDDYVSGSHSIEQGKSQIAEIISCLSSGGFSLRKWSSNDKSILENVNLSQQYSSTSFIFKTENTAKTLGLRWDSIKDEFNFQYTVSEEHTIKLTKRALLSEISRLFDPLGWLAPLTLTLKLLFRNVWQDPKIQWSDEVSADIKNEWKKLTEDLSLINEISIPRWLKSEEGDVIQFHGFCDASLKAYACVIYARIVRRNTATVVLVAAKSRLAPNNKSVSLPRLELCAAELLSKLLSKVTASIGSSAHYNSYAWSDSTVALSWIQGNPDRWKPFVSNRVKKITSILAPKVWFHVPTKENPADAASRDENGILRVGGRLKNANISADMKYPIIIPYSSNLTELLIQQAHELTFHGGSRLTLSILRQNYWIIKGNRATKKQLRNCVTCKKQEPSKQQQIMGHLPDFRSNPAPPFYHTGVDFTGFIRVKSNKGRGVKTTKGYISLFVCMVTKAVHIEVVSDLSSLSFISALRRMAARRGTPKHIYSDNGTNFVGANKILQEDQQQLEQLFNDTFHKEIVEMNIHTMALELSFLAKRWRDMGTVYPKLKAAS